MKGFSTPAWAAAGAVVALTWGSTVLAEPPPGKGAAGPPKGEAEPTVGVVTNYQPGSGKVTIDGKPMKLSVSAELALQKRLESEGWRPGSPFSAQFGSSTAPDGSPTVEGIQPLEKP
jgi:hypothetical protein